MRPSPFPPELLHAIPLSYWRDWLDAHHAPAALTAADDHAKIAAALGALRLSDGLTSALRKLETLASHLGREALLDAAADMHIDARDWPRDEASPALAARLLTAAARDPEGAMPGVIRRAEVHVFRAGVEGREAYEFVAHSPRPTALGGDIDDALEEVRLAVSAFCARHGRLPFAEVHWVRDVRGLVVEVRRTQRFDASVCVEPETHAFAIASGFPVATDTIAIDAQAGRIAVTTRAPRIVRTYVKAFGRALFGDEGYFDEMPTYTLEPLRARGRRALDPSALGAQIAEVRLIEIAWDSGVRESHVLSGQDCFDALERDGVRLEGGTIAMAKLRLSLTAGDRKATVTVRPPHRVVLPSGPTSDLVRAYLEAVGLSRPATDGEDLWSLDPWIHPAARWKAVFGASLAERVHSHVLVPFQSRAVVHPDYPNDGRALIALPLAEEPGVFYGVSEAAHVPSRTLHAADLSTLRLDPIAFGASIARALKLEGVVHEIDRMGLFDLGARRLTPKAIARVHLVARRPGVGAAAIGVRLRERYAGERVVLLVPRGRRADVGLPEVALPNLPENFSGLVGAVVRALGLEADVEPVLFAPPDARLVIDELRDRVWVDGVAMSKLSERHVRLLKLLAKSQEPVAAKLADEVVSPARGDEGAARKAKLELADLMAASFVRAGLHPPKDLATFVAREGRRGYRLAVSFFLA